MIVSNGHPILLIRPRKNDGESFPAYITRICELNRTPGPSWLAQRLGLTYGQMVMMGHQSFFDVIRGALPAAAVRPEIPANGALMNSIGMCTQARICPRCLAEGRPCASQWDWPLTVACVIHGLCLIDRCPRCGLPVSHLRRRLHSCKCGLDWRDCSSRAAPNWLDDFYRIFAPWRRGDPVSHPDVDELERKSLALLLDCLHVPTSSPAGRPRRKSETCHVSRLDSRLLDEIWLLVNDWPITFSERMSRLLTVSRQRISKTQHRASSLGLVVLADEIRRVRIHARKSAPKTATADEIRSIHEIAKLLELNYAGVRNLIASGRLKVEGGATRWQGFLVPSDETERLRQLARSSLRLASAASRIGCSSFCLNVLARADAVPSLRPTANSVSWRFHLAGLDDLVANLMTLAMPESAALGDRMVALRTISGGDVATWVSIMRRILARVLPLYRSEQEPQDLRALLIRASDLPQPRRDQR